MAKLKLQGKDPKAISIDKYDRIRKFTCFKCRKTETVFANHEPDNVHRILSYNDP